MSPPSYNELGSQARELFSKHYRKDKSITLKTEKKLDNLAINQRIQINSKA